MKLSYRKNKSKKAMAILLPVLVAIVSVVGISVGRSTYADTYNDFSANDLTFEKGTEATAPLAITSSKTGTYVGMTMEFPTSESGDSTLFSLNDLAVADGIIPSTKSTETGQIYWADLSLTGVEVAAGVPLIIGTYTVADNVPAGEYSFPIYVSAINLADADIQNFTLTAKITVTEPQKPQQTIVFKDADNNPVTAVNKHYGDDDFVVTAEVTDENGTLGNYYPNDDGTGSIVQTLGGGKVHINGVGQMEVCVDASETATYAATKGCYTVNVDKRPISMVGAVVRNKAYDGTTDATVDSATFDYTGVGTDDYTVSGVFDGADVGDDKDVTVTAELTDAGAKKYVLSGNTYEASANISKKEVTVTEATVPDKTYDATTNSAVSNVVLSDGLNFGTDFTASASYADANVGTSKVVTITINLSDDAYKNYSFANGVQSTEVITNATITPLTLKSNNTSAVLNTTEYIYSGNANQPTATVKVTIGENEYTLTQNDDFTIHYPEDTVNVGNRTVAIEGTGNYTGTIEGLGFAVVPAPVIPVIGDIEAVTYNANAQKPSLNVTTTFGGNSLKLVEGIDYTVSYNNNINAGAAIAGIAPVDGSNYTFAADTYTKNFTINPYSLANSDISLEYTVVRYNGSEQQPGVTVVVNGEVIDQNDYTVTYGSDTIGNDNTDTVVTVTVEAKANKNITGSATTNYTITPREVLTIDGISDNQKIVYTGDRVALEGSLSVSENTDNINASDLETTWYAADGTTVIEQPTVVGEYVVKYSYDGTNYKGELVVGFEIIKADSGEPSEMSAGFRVEAGTKLGEVSSALTEGFAWGDAETTVAAGQNGYAATYTRNNDTANYNTSNLSVPVYGLTRVGVSVSTDGEGGSISASSETVLEGDSVTITISPEEKHALSLITVNGEDYTNKVSGNTLMVTAGTEDLAVEAVFMPVYEVIEGAGQNYVLGGDGATFRIDADYSLFENGGKVYVDGVLVDESNYVSWDGSTYIQFTADYMNSLSAGTHTLAVLLNDGGMATANFTVTDPTVTETTAGDTASETAGSPDTGAFTGNVGGAAATSVLIGFAVAGAVLYASKIILKNKQ